MNPNAIPTDPTCPLFILALTGRRCSGARSRHGIVLLRLLPRLASEPAARRDVRRLRPQSAALPLLRALGICVQRRPARPRQVTLHQHGPPERAKAHPAAAAALRRPSRRRPQSTNPPTSHLQPPPAASATTYDDRLLIIALPEGRWWVPTVCWTLSYALSISFRFVSHAALVFGPHRDPPLLALGKTYLT